MGEEAVMRIAYAAEATPNGFYRAVWPMTALARFNDHRVRALAREPERWTSADVEDIDVLFVHRMCDEPAYRLVRQAKSNGAALVWDDDDDVGTAIESIAAHKRLGTFTAKRRVAETRRILALADLVTFPSHHLAQRFLALGASRAETIENHLPDDFFQPTARPHEGLVVGWVAALEHQMESRPCPSERCSSSCSTSAPTCAWQASASDSGCAASAMTTAAWCRSTP